MFTSGKDKGRSPEWLEKILDWNTKQTDKEDYKCDHYPAGPIRGISKDRDSIRCPGIHSARNLIKIYANHSLKSPKLPGYIAKAFQLYTSCVKQVCNRSL